MKKQKETSVKAYKVFDSNWQCRGFQFEVGKSYSIKGEPVMCEKGFHACLKVQDCFSYYSFDPANKVAEVELSGTVLGLDSDKQCSQKITIIRELSWNEMLGIANSGKGNSGNSNSGNSNSGNSNSGNSNSGNSNSGNWNSGNWNSGNWNSGNSNSGYSNSGHSNSGNWNSGNSNSGHSNSGNSNSGHSNSGNWNSGNSNSGFFNSKTPDMVMVFNKPCKRDVFDNARKPNFIYDVPPNEWVEWDSMTDDEKKDNPNAFVCGGYLKTYSYKEAWANAYKKATKEDISLLKALPNFDSAVFEEITGIHIE